MRPSRIIVGEVRAEECLDLLLALNAGVPGMCTLHANSAREALVKMCTLPLLAGENISARFVVPTVAASVDLVVHLGIDPHGVRRVNEIVGVPGPRRERRDRDRADLRAAPAASSAVPAGCRRGRRTTSGSASTSTRSCRRGALMGVLVGPRGRHRPAAGLVGVRRAAPSPRVRRHALGVPRSCWPAPGSARCRSPAFIALCVVCGVARGAADAGRHAHAAGGGAVRRDGRRTCRWLVVSAAARRRQREFAEVWPEAVDNLASRRPRRAVPARRPGRPRGARTRSRCARRSTRSRSTTR